MESKECSVYSLLTQLCENVLIQQKAKANQENIRKLRKRAFEILLSKTPSELPEALFLDSKSDLHCQILALQYVMRKCSRYEEADNLERNFQIINKSSKNAYDLKNVLSFLLRLNRVFKQNIKKDDNLKAGTKFFRIFNSASFTLDDQPMCKETRFNSSSFHMWPKSKTKFLPKSKSLNFHIQNDSNSLTTFEKKSFEFVNPDTEDVWEAATKCEFTDRKTWSSFRAPSPAKEPMFLTEANNSACSDFNKLEFYTDSCLLDEEKSQEILMLPRESFIKDLKLLLVGKVSKSFVKINDEITLNPRVILEGFLKATLDSYCSLFINCYTCYMALKEMVGSTTQISFRGIIYGNLCLSVSQYLKYYEFSISQINLSMGLLELRNHLSQISVSLFEIASLCKVGPYIETQKLPTGVSLLQNIYRRVLSNVSTDVALVLSTLLYSMLRIYFSHFLRPWILQGKINDPYNEFFILPTHKYFNTRGRTYWTRSFTICEGLVPLFLSADQADDIFLCGKMMNLLQLCQPHSLICSEIGKALDLIECQINFTKLSDLNLQAKRFYLQLASNTAKFSLRNHFQIIRDEQLSLGFLAMQKRAQFVKKKELKKVQKIQQDVLRKKALMQQLKQQCDEALIQKKAAKIAELREELEIEKKAAEIRKLEERIIAEEAERMINHYEGLMQKAEVFNISIEKHNESLNSVHLGVDSEGEPEETAIEITEKPPAEEHFLEDLVNANKEAHENKPLDNSTLLNDVEENANVYYETKKEAQSIRLKYLREELGIRIEDTNSLSDLQKNRRRVLGSSLQFKYGSPQNQLTEAQRNKMKVMLVEYGDSPSYETNKKTTVLWDDKKQEVNIDKVCNKSSGDYCWETKSLPEIINADSKNVVDEIIPIIESKSAEFYKKPNFDFFTFEGSASEKNVSDSKPEEPVFEDKNKKCEFDKISLRYIGKSASIPVEMQNVLLKEQLLKFFVLDLKYLEHLEKLRCFYFLLDGKFARNVTKELFEKVYFSTSEGAKVQTLKNAMSQALKLALIDYESENSSNVVSFIVNNLPKDVSCTNLAMLDCISLSYKIGWPLNILLPTEILVKYNEVFKFLLKITRASWILRTVSVELKSLIKQCGRLSPMLHLSEQYIKVQNFRHIMSHFVHTFESYILGQVLQSSWTEFQKAIQSADSLDELYSLHSAYLKNIHFMCLLNQSCVSVKKAITHILTVVVKFYDYLRSREWFLDEDEFVHPNFKKLKGLFDNFLELVEYLFKTGRKVVKTGFQPQFVQLIDMLDVNQYYSSIFKMTD